MERYAIVTGSELNRLAGIHAELAAGNASVTEVWKT